MTLWEKFKLYQVLRRIDMKKAFMNWHTTLAGAVAGASGYLVMLGPNLPSADWTAQQWGAFAFNLALAVGGALAKDGRTGSAPGADRKSVV